MKKPSSPVTVKPNSNRLDRRSTNHNDYPSHVSIPTNQKFALEPTAPSITRERGPSTPNLLSAEMWILQGGGVKNGNIPMIVKSSSHSVKTSKPSIQPPMTKHQQQHRGRSPNHRSPSKQSSSAVHHRTPTTNKNTTSPSSFASNEQLSPSSVLPSSTKYISTATPVPKLSTKSMNHVFVRSSETSKDSASPSVCPIPSIYISYIRKAFGGGGRTYSSETYKNTVIHHRPIDLYTEVLGLPYQPNPYTDTQIRVAYFRQGRLALQQSSSPNSSIIHEHDTNTNVMPGKQVFQAITKAYEIVTNPQYRAYYETYGLPPLKPDAPAAADITQHQHSTHVPVAKTSTTPSTRSSRRIDPEEDDHNDKNHTNPTRLDNDNIPSVEALDENEDDVDSVVSIGSILRNSSYDKNRQRSKSWGPASSSSSRQRVVWKEVVQELIYQPDPPPNHSIEFLEHQQPKQQLDLQSFVFSGTIPSTKMTQHQQEIEDRDFLDDLEASVDGMGETIGNFVKYLSKHNLSKHNLPKHSIVKNDDDNDTTGSEGNPVPRAIIAEENNSSQLNCQLSKDLTERTPAIDAKKVNTVQAIPIGVAGSDVGGAYAKRIAEYHRRSHSCDDKTNARRERCKSITTTAPLKEGKTDQEPRTKPKKSKRKKKLGVDKVPSFMTDAVDGTNLDYDVFDPFQFSIDASIDFGAIDPLIDAWTTHATSNERCVHDPITSTKNTVLDNTKFDPYELPEVSSILASLDGGTQETPTLNVSAEKSLSFDDALNRTTDATTKGFIRLDRRSTSLSTVSNNRVPSMDVSEITYSSNLSDDPAGRHFHFEFLSSITQSAKATIKEIASFDEENEDKVDPVSGNNVAAAASYRSTPPSHVATNPPNNVDLFSQFNTFMQSLVEDMNKIGTQISSNLYETNRVVRDNMAFPEAEVSGFLERIGTGLQFTTAADANTDSDLQQSFTY